MERSNLQANLNQVVSTASDFAMKKEMYKAIQKEAQTEAEKVELENQQQREIDYEQEYPIVGTDDQQFVMVRGNAMPIEEFDKRQAEQIERKNKEAMTQKAKDDLLKRYGKEKGEMFVGYHLNKEGYDLSTAEGYEQADKAISELPNRLTTKTREQAKKAQSNLTEKQVEKETAKSSVAQKEATLSEEIDERK